MTWDALRARPLPLPSATVRLGDAAWSVVDVWRPVGPGPHPTVVMVHGGCWQKAIADRTLMNYAAEDLRQRGLGVWNIEYRGVDEPGGGYPGTFLDVAGAADALRSQGPRFDLRADRIVGFGHSAGGHLVAWLAARGRLSPSTPLYASAPLALAGIVISGGLADLEASRPVTAADCLAVVYDRLIGAPRAEALADTSPVSLLPLGVTQICVNGERDRIAPPVLGEAYTAKAKAAGDNALFECVPDQGHVELIAPGTPAFEAQARHLLRLADP
jgi:acetyl esterase/lipase